LSTTRRGFVLSYYESDFSPRFPHDEKSLDPPQAAPFLKRSSSTSGKINETESSEYWPEMRKTTALYLDHFRVRNPHPNILIGTASDRYAGRIGQIYSDGR
jgi:hypothetical protein